MTSPQLCHTLLSTWVLLVVITVQWLSLKCMTAGVTGLYLVVVKDQSLPCSSASCYKMHCRASCTVQYSTVQDALQCIFYCTRCTAVHPFLSSWLGFCLCCTDLNCTDLNWCDLNWHDLTWPDPTWPDLSWPVLFRPVLSWPVLYCCCC